MKAIREENSDKCHVKYVQCDISAEAQLEARWREIIREYGPVNIIVNNAARSIGKRVKEMSVGTFRRTMEINFLSIVQLNRMFME